MNDPKDGLLLVFPRDDAKQLFAARGDEALAAFLSEHLAQPSDSQPEQLGLQRLWHLIHTLLCDGDHAEDGGTMPLNQVILGGRSLYTGDDRIVRLVRPDIVGHAASALKQLDHDALNTTFQSIDLTEVCHLNSGDDATLKFDSIRSLINKTTDLFENAASQGAAVVFYADFS